LENKKVIITKEQIKNIMKNHFFYIEYRKKDGSLRKMNGRFGVTKNLKGGKSKTDHVSTMIPVYDMGKKAYRTLNLDKIEFLQCGNIELGIKSEEKE
jgi:hypothetical protein